MKRAHANDELRWTASRYVLGELSTDDTARFEALLIDDQAAQDAVADAVSLLQTVSMPLLGECPRKRPSFAIPFAVVVTLCLLIGVGIYFAPTPPSVADARRVDDAWILDLPELLEEQAATIETSEPAADDFEAIVPAVGEDADAEPPGWLILATSKVGTS